MWGCRGSLAAPGPATVLYGGNTSCLELRLEDGTLLVLDAGTGIRELGRTLAGHEGPIHLLLTHLHLDHVEGLGFFGPFWSPEAELHLWGPRSPLHTLEERISRYLSPPLFPLSVADSPAHLHFHDVPEEPWRIGSATVSAGEVAHPGPTLGYRIEEGGAALAYIPDHEPALGVEVDAVPPEWLSGHGVAAAATVLLHDAQLTEDEYQARIGGPLVGRRRGCLRSRRGRRAPRPLPPRPDARRRRGRAARSACPRALARRQRLVSRARLRGHADRPAAYYFASVTFVSPRG